MRKRTYLKPENLDIAALATEPVYCLLGRFNVKGSSDLKERRFGEYKTKKLVKHFAKCYYFIHQLISANNSEHEGDRAVFTNLSQELLQDGMGEAGYDVSVSLLHALGVIECDNDHEPPYEILRSKDPITGERREAKCRGFKLTQAYRRETVQVFADEAYLKLLVRKKKNSEKRVKKRIQNTPAFLYQMNQMLSYNFKVDDSAFKGGVQSLLGNVDHKGKIITQAKVNVMLNYLDLLSAHSVELFKPDSYGRLWTPMVLLQRQARPFVTDYDGNPLIKLDFKSSYAFNLIKLIKDVIRIKQGKKVNTYLTKFKRKINLLHADLFDGLEQEVDFLYQKCMTTGVYEYIAREYYIKFGRKIHGDVNIATQLAKDSWNQTFLNTGSYKNYLAQHIRQLFPKIDAFIEEWGRHKKLWGALQRLEANLVHHRIIARVQKDIGLECTLFGIHDAVVTDQYHDGRILDIMYQESFDYFGFKVRVTRDPLIHENYNQSEYIEELALATNFS